MCTIRHYVTVLVFVMIPERIFIIFMVLRQEALRQDACMKAGRPVGA